MPLDRLEGRNPFVEAILRRRRRIVRIFLDQGARPDPKIDMILRHATERRIPVERHARQSLDRMAQGRVHNGIIADAEPLPSHAMSEILAATRSADTEPVYVLADEVVYEHNLGAILRSALGFGVDALVIPTKRGVGLSPVVQRVSMGAAEAIPVVREGISSALKQLSREGVRVVGADMNGTPLGRANLRGPLAIVMGGEGKGLSPTLRNKCDDIVSIPLAGDLESLNVSVATAILLYEKRRQDGWYSTNAS